MMVHETHLLSLIISSSMQQPAMINYPKSLQILKKKRQEMEILTFNTFGCK